ncbi:SusC/RagA family TonB-linked outer membrane protein [Pontibacter flavimaris]|uniref:SusC/RagA family protein n=1 Tax=Pontibacter flavimaris TaxID=1797110 RepID=A0A1Q5PDP9_9BACT|nr:TonB-dependent receptor [Pontibacter flavimaris]OKL40344.1 SusC/RagA family protein [Pontibacter flavimaris]
MQNKYTRRIRAIGLSTVLCCLGLPGTTQHVYASGDVQLELAASNWNKEQGYISKSLKATLHDLQRKFGIQFSYKADVADNLQLRVPASLEGEKDADLLLGRILAPAGLSYKKVNEVYIIQKTAAAPAPVNNVVRQLRSSVNSQTNVTVSGTVTDETGVGLPGVTVVLRGTTRGTSTDASGNFKIEVPQTGAVLVLSYIGYTTQEVTVGNQTNINVVLAQDTKALQEVVVVGYGTQRKSDITGSVTAISEEDFQQGNITTPEQLIQGKVAGVQISSNGGAPGSGSRIRIRGGSSLNASNDPLIVIDGVPVDNSSIAGSANPLSLINPNDIETFNVLKDASATAIYGSRASNGVIIITTKKGRAGDKLKVSLSSLASISQLRDKVDVLRGDEYRAVVNQYATDENKALLGDADTDWQDLIFRDAVSHDHNLSVSGSVKSIPYRVSVGYLNQEGILKTSEMKRATGSVSLNPTFLDDHLSVNLNVKGVKSEHQFANEGVIGSAVSFDPTQSPYDNREANRFGGYFEWYKIDDNGNPIVNTLAPRNPLSTLEQTDDQSDVSRSIGNIQLDYKFHFLPALRANLNLGYDVSKGEGSITLPTTLAAVYVQGGSFREYSQEKTNNLLDFYLNYVEEYENIQSRVDFTAGYSYQKFKNEQPPFATFNIAGDTLVQAPNPIESTNVLLSYFGRMNYAFKDRYILTATVRRDGSSRFSPDNRWGTFPSLAFAWRINEEPFLQNVTAISDLKLRVGYGITGQQDIGGFYPYLARYSPSNTEASYQFGDTFYRTLRPQGYDENIKWEETKTYNAGLDFGFLNNRISGSLDYYFKKTDDLLAIIPVPAGSNLTNRLYTNVGSIENRGLEAVLNFNAISTEKLTWDISLNGTYNENEITSLSRLEDEDAVGIPVGGIGGGVGNTIQVHTVGFPTYSYYVYKQVYDVNGRPVEGLYADLNGDGSITDQDLYRYKNPEPKAFFGFSSQLTYGKWNLGFVLRGSVGNYAYNNIKANTFYSNIDWEGYLLTIPSSINEFGFVGPDDPNRQYSDYFVENASFLRMDNLNLGYNVGSILNDKVNLRVTATGQNLFVITKYDGLDPEVTGGIDNNFYPRPRVLSLGVNLDFQ